MGAGAAPLRLRTILVPHDFSAGSARILRYAAGLADRAVGVIHLLHVIPAESALAPLESALPNRDVRRIRVEQAALEARLAEAGAGLRAPVERHVRIGSPPAVICELAWLLRADLIVMGRTSGRRRAAWLCRSLAERTLRGAPCPVLTIAASSAEPTESA